MFVFCEEDSSKSIEIRPGKDYVLQHFVWMAYKEVLRGILNEIRWKND